MRRTPCRLLVLFAVASASGCALTAKKVPTPAADITSADLARLPPRPGERFFLVLFGSQNALRQPQYTHTSAALVRVRAADVGASGSAVPGCIDPALDVQMISWLPVAGKIDALSREVEPGRNFGLHETMKFAYDSRQSVAVWGPYEVWHGFAHRFEVQKRFLDSGAVGYQCIDTWGEAARSGNGCDCIHAITDMDPVYARGGYPLLYYGKPGTARVVRRLMHSPVFLDPRTTHDWLLPRLGLGAYPLEKRRYLGLVADEHDPNSPADLDTRTPALPVSPLPKEAPKDAPKVDPKSPPEARPSGTLPEPAPLPRNGPPLLPQPPAAPPR
jgi:hypothetical protein